MGGSAGADSPRKRTEPEETVGVPYWPGPMVCNVTLILSPGETEMVVPLPELSRPIPSLEVGEVPQDKASRTTATTAVALRNRHVPRLNERSWEGTDRDRSA